VSGTFLLDHRRFESLGPAGSSADLAPRQIGNTQSCASGDPVAEAGVSESIVWRTRAEIDEPQLADVSLGLLFGLGFDTASEVGLIAMTAGASAGSLPIPAVLCLPILFAAGMTVMDTTDGVLMSKAYDWAFINPLRKIFYNITTTGLSVAVALLVGSVELLQVLIGILDLHGRFLDAIAALDFGKVGYVIVGMFLLAWTLSVGVWKFGRIEERYPMTPSPTRMSAFTPAGLRHSHDHIHPQAR